MPPEKMENEMETEAPKGPSDGFLISAIEPIMDQCHDEDQMDRILEWAFAKYGPPKEPSITHRTLDALSQELPSILIEIVKEFAKDQLTPKPTLTPGNFPIRHATPDEIAAIERAIRHGAYPAKMPRPRVMPEAHECYPPGQDSGPRPDDVKKDVDQTVRGVERDPMDVIRPGEKAVFAPQDGDPPTKPEKQ